jgi:hypothetical protein
MGRTQQAAYNRSLALQMAGQNGTGPDQIRWVGPDAFGTAQSASPGMAGAMPVAAQQPYNQRTAQAPPRTAQQYTPTPPTQWR